MTKVRLETSTFLPLKPQLETGDKAVVIRYGDYILRSQFQPIYSFAHNTQVGFEALLDIRSIDDASVSGREFYAHIATDAQLLELHSLIHRMHILNFMQAAIEDAWLFLKVNSSLLGQCQTCMRHFFELINDLDFPPTRIVMQFSIIPGADFNQLVSVADYIRQGGCLLAIDEFGTAHSDFNIIWDLQPDIVRLGPAMLERLEQHSGYTRIFSGFVELLHEGGTLVLLSGIEDSNDANHAFNINVDLHQGSYFGQATDSLQHTMQADNPYMGLAQNHTEVLTGSGNGSWLSEQLEILFRMAATAAQPDIPLHQSCERLLNHPYVERCFMLDAEGFQIGQSVYGQHAIKDIDARYRALGKTSGANWSRRHYFKRAIDNPLSVQVTRPYLSLTGAHLCVTLSSAIVVLDQHYVLCCDIKWAETVAKSGRRK